MREMEVIKNIATTVSTVAEVILVGVFFWGAVTFNLPLVLISMLFLGFFYFVKMAHTVVDLLEEQRLTNALLVEVLVEMNPELEDACDGDCENCICGMKDENS